MKIAIIHSLYKPFYRGGAEVVVEAIAHGLTALGHEVQVITLGRENNIEVIDGVTIVRIKPWNIFNFIDINSQPVWKRFVWHIIDMCNDVQVYRVYRALKAFGPELVMTHNLKGLGYTIPRIAALFNVSVIHTVHDQQLLHPAGLTGERLTFFARLYMTICRWLFASPSVVIFPSHAIEQRYEKNNFFSKSKKIVLGNPLPYPVPELIKSTDRKSYNLLYLGQVEKYKGILELIEAVKQISNPRLRLHVVGDGQALTQAKTAASGDERIIFHGRASSQQWLREHIWPITDLLVLPSHAWESFGMVVIEAFAHGVPVLASRQGALPELVEDRMTGWLLDEVNPEKIAQKIEWIMTSACRLENMRILCHARAKDYEINGYLKRLLESVTIDTQ